MLILEEMQSRGHEALTLLHHAPSGLRAALAIHSTVLGPAIAGVRLREQDEELAVRGALALSESLTLKAEVQHVRVSRTRHHSIHADPCGSRVQCGCAHERGDAAFGGPVGGVGSASEANER